MLILGVFDTSLLEGNANIVDLGKKIKFYVFLSVLLNVFFFMWMDYFHYHKHMEIRDYPISFFIKYIVLFISSYLILYLVGRVIHTVQNKMNDERHFFSTISNTVEAFIMAIDKNGEIKQINKYCETETGYSLKDIQGKYFWDIFICEEERQDYIDAFRKLSSSQANHLVLKDGTRKYIQWANTFVQNDSGEVQYVVVTGIDITERRIVEEKLKRHKESYEQLVEYHPDPIIAFNNDIIYFYNYTSMDLLETSERLAGKPIYNYIAPKYREFVKNRVEMLIENKIDFIEFDDFEVITELGNVKTVECIGISNYIWGKEVVQLVLRDVTEKKKTEKLLQKSEKLAVIGQLAAGVAHEIRNPLTSIQGFLKVIYSQMDSEEIKDFIKITLEEVNRINSVTNELLFLAKPQKEVVENINIQALLSDVTHFIDSEANLKNIMIETTSTDGNLMVCGIANHLKQVFLNIFKNSMDAMPAGGKINVELGVEEHLVKVKITDHGVGIPDDRLKHIGEPFYSLKENGTGLGLMITKKIIKEHQGIFEIESEIGVGTTICIKLPMV